MRYRFPAAFALSFVLTILLFVPSADAQYFGQNRVQYEVFDFKTLETEHFVFHFYPEEEAAVRDAARMAERWYDRHTQVFLHSFDEKKPILFYANDADFQQTNVAQRQPSQGTGGLTEPLRERVVMPLATSYGETDHVLGHELVHSFQFDLALNDENSQIQLRNLPLWLVEGMAEYLSVGRRSSHTAMWMRDAVRRDDMPAFDDLANPREYFPYRYGHAYLSYVAGKYGDQAVTDLFKTGGSSGLKKAYPRLFGVSADSLTREWAAATREAYRPLMADRTAPDSLGETVLSPEMDAGRTNVAPTLSPDGRYVAFISERDLFQFNLFVADAETGEVIAELERSGTTGHFNALRFISSAGTWSPDGRRLAFVTSAEGDNQITIWNVQTEEIERSVKVKGVNALTNPAWSPGGDRLAFSGTDGGVSDLYVLDLESRQVRQLTDDRYADLQPTWSPDGETLAFTTDRAETDLDQLTASKHMDLGLVDVASGEITVRDPFGDALHHNPQFSPDGRSLYFISDQDGFKDVYRLERASGERRRVTHLKTGVSGITALSPAMSVARQNGEMMLSVFGDDRYTGVRLAPDSTTGTLVADAGSQPAAPAVPPAPDTTEGDTTDADAPATGESGYADAGVLPPASPSEESIVASRLNDPATGLPPAPADTAVEDLDSSLSLEGIASSGVGVSVGGRFGNRAGGGIGFRFGDMLGHRTLTVSVQARGTLRDIGGGVSYVNRRGQLNWGGALSHRPVIFRANSFRLNPTSAVSVVRRAYITSANGLLSYPLDPTRRFEFTAGATRYGFGVNVQSAGLQQDPSLDDLGLPEAQDPKYLATAGAAYVRDFSVSALTGPIRGGRWRLGVTPTAGVQNFVTARADVRRYLYKKPFTLALQGLHVGNYGASFDDEFGVGNEYIGEPYRQGFVRGYNVRDISAGIRENGGCTEVAGTPARSQCAEIDRLFGTRSLVGRVELRVPLLGPERLSLIPLPYVPTTLGAFADAGVTWTEDAAPDFRFETQSSATNIPVVSTGVTARFNVLGRFLVETYLARPFQRRDKTWSWGVRFSPGF